MEKKNFMKKVSVEQRHGIVHEKDFAIAIHQMNEVVGVHIHDCYELEILLKGEMDLRLNGKRFNVNPGHFWISLPNNLHDVIKRTDEVRVLNIKIKDGVLSNKVYNLLGMYGDGIVGKISDEEVDVILKMYEKFSDIFNSVKSELCRSILIKNTIESILVTLIDRCDGTECTLTDKVAEHDIFEAISYVKKHFTEELTAADMAKRLGYTPNYFSMKFKRLTGKNFIETVNDERLQLAYYMLSTMNISVNDVSDYVGYSSIAYFSRMFKKKYNKSPREVKKQGHTDKK